jgi:hypothetical protein
MTVRQGVPPPELSALERFHLVPDIHAKAPRCLTTRVRSRSLTTNTTTTTPMTSLLPAHANAVSVSMFLAVTPGLLLQSRLQGDVQRNVARVMSMVVPSVQTVTASHNMKTIL